MSVQRPRRVATDPMSRPRNANLARIKLVSGLAFSKQDVYEPAEDSFLLADVILAESADWGAGQVPRVFVEIGSGSGYVVASVASMLRNDKTRGCYCLAVDINRVACVATKETLSNHALDGNVDVVNCDALVPFLGRLEGAVDLVAFNPPYVLTPDEEVSRGGIAAAWAGEHKGRAVIDRVLEMVAGTIAPDGRMYMIAIHENEPEEIMEEMRRRGFDAAIVATQVADEEVLHVLRFIRQC